MQMQEEHANFTQKSYGQMVDLNLGPSCSETVCPVICQEDLTCSRYFNRLPATASVPR